MASSFAAPALQAAPNVVLLFCDDMGYADVSCQGAKYPTPNLDKLADEGTRFTRFYVPHPVCSPSRAAILTGCYSQRFGINWAIRPGAKTGLKSSVPTLPSLMKKQGYATGMFGKWHIGEQPDMTPIAHGFDQWIGTIVSHDYNKGKIPLINGKDNSVIIEEPTPAELTRRCTDGALKFLDENAKKNFFLYVPYNLPHVPLGVSDKNKGSSKRGLYGDTMKDIDDSVGEILAKIDKLDLRDNTIVIFTSDNGPWLRYGNHSGAALPLRQGKGTIYEGGIRMPFFIRWPGKIPAKRINDAPLSSIDLLPSLAEPVGYPVPKVVDGHNLWPLLTGKAQANDDTVYWFSYGGPVQAVSQGKWKLILPHETQVYDPAKYGKDGGEGTVSRRKITSPELYDLSEDVGEKKDLSKKNPEVVKKLQELAQQRPWKK
jgi:arylsulfatase